MFDPPHLLCLASLLQVLIILGLLRSRETKVLQGKDFLLDSEQRLECGEIDWSTSVGFGTKVEGVRRKFFFRVVSALGALPQE